LGFFYSYFFGLDFGDAFSLTAQISIHLGSLSFRCCGSVLNLITMRSLLMQEGCCIC